MAKLEEVMTKFTYQQLLDIAENKSRSYDEDTVGAARKELQLRGFVSPEENEEWYYTTKGYKYGPMSKDALMSLYGQGTITLETRVWRKGFENWTELAKTELISNIEYPPLLAGPDVDNTLIWVLAFTPILGLILEVIVSKITEIQVGNLWLITVLINIIICTIDIAYLKKLGYTEKGLLFWGLSLIPVYLFKRAKLLKQKKYYFFVWIFSFIMLILAGMIMDNSGGNAINTLKNASLTGYPDRTVNALIDGFVVNPKWEVIVDDSGNTYVNISGEIVYDSSRAKMILQYKRRDNKTFDFHALEINGEPQNIVIYNMLIQVMYDELLGPTSNIAGKPNPFLQNKKENASMTEQPSVNTELGVEDFNVNQDLEIYDYFDMYEGLLFGNAGDDYIILDGLSISTGERRDMLVDINGDGEEEMFIIEWDNPNGVKFLGVLGNRSQNFAYDIEAYAPFDDFGELQEGYYVQITCYDLDQDGRKEILVSVGDKLSEMETLIYTPANTNSEEPFRLVDRMYGEDMMYFGDGMQSIITPYGGQGAYVEHVYRDGQLYQLEY